jgi:hypothetical protein
LAMGNGFAPAIHFDVESPRLTRDSPKKLNERIIANALTESCSMY